MAVRDITQLFLTYRREVHRYLTHKLRDEEVAADLTQETFLRFAEHGSANPAAIITHERSYLYQTAHNLAVDYVRQMQHEKLDFVAHNELPDLPAAVPTPEQSACNLDELSQVQTILSGLPHRTRQVFIAVRVENMTYREAAHHLGISESAVQKHLALAVQLVMQGLRPAGNKKQTDIY